MGQFMNKVLKISRISILLIVFTAVSALPVDRKPVSYPLGFSHGMSQEAALSILKGLDSDIIHKSNRAIHAHYGKLYYGVKVSEIDLRFADDKLNGVTLKTEGVESDEGNSERLTKFADAIKATYNVYEKPNDSSVDSTADIKTRFVSRYRDGGYEILIYSYYLNGKYYLTLNFEKFS